MTPEDLADLVRANSANTNRRITGTRNETYGRLLNLQSELTDVRGDLKTVRSDLADVRTDVAEVRRTLDFADTVAAMERQIETLEAEVAALKRRA